MTIPPDALHAFLALYAAGEYWESHEVLEGPWRESRDDFTQALILLASAWVHWQRGNAHGVRAQLAKTLDRLEECPERCQGFDVAAIRACCHQVRQVVEEHPEDWRERVPRAGGAGGRRGRLAVVRVPGAQGQRFTLSATRPPGSGPG